MKKLALPLFCALALSLAAFSPAKADTCSAGPDCTITCKNGCAAMIGGDGTCHKQCFDNKKAEGEKHGLSLTTKNAEVEAIMKMLKTDKKDEAKE